MKEAIAFSRKFSGALVIEVTTIDDDEYSVLLDDRGMVVPAIEQCPGRFIVDEEYLDQVKSFVAAIEKPQKPMHVRFLGDGTMVEAPKDASIEPGDEPGGPKP